MADTFPPVQPNGSLMIAWQVKDKPVLVIGGGEVAASRILHLLNASALITILCPPSGLHPEVTHRLRTHPDRITHIPRSFSPSDLDASSYSMVLSAIDDPEASTQIWQACKARRIPVNVADVPSECDFYFGAVYRDGPVQVMVSTNGKGPRMAGLIRDRIGECLAGGGTGRAVENVGVLRGMLRVKAPGQEEGKKRMGWISRVCERWSLEELGGMEEADMDVLLGYYERNQVPSREEVRRIRGRSTAEDSP